MTPPPTTGRALGVGLTGLLGLALLAACSAGGRSEEVLARIPLDSTDELITRSDVSLDREVTVDGGGSIRIDAPEPLTVRIAEIEMPPVESARLVYRARLRSAGLVGRAYLEMLCDFPGQGEYFSRGLQAPLEGTNDWLFGETPFLLQEGQRPSRVKLNLVIDGKGTVWIDDVVLARAPLH